MPAAVVGAGSKAHCHSQRGGIAFGGDARSDERLAFSEEFGVDDALRPVADFEFISSRRP
jgi:hypothetical protein